MCPAVREDFQRKKRKAGEKILKTEKSALKFSFPQGYFFVSAHKKSLEKST